MSTVNFEMDDYTGRCFTKCPYGRDCFVNSSVCSECMENFGIIGEDKVLLCTGGKYKERRSA